MMILRACTTPPGSMYKLHVGSGCRTECEDGAPRPRGVMVSRDADMEDGPKPDMGVNVSSHNEASVRP